MSRFLPKSVITDRQNVSPKSRPFTNHHDPSQQPCRKRWARKIPLSPPFVKLSSFQNNDTASALRIRENQRRSRNRRKELIEELQGRLNEYERRGVEATQDMQRAARKVAQENMRLRSLLSRHGVSQEEVEVYLRVSETEAPGDASVDAIIFPTRYHNGLGVPSPSPVSIAPRNPSDHQRTGPNTVNISNNTNNVHRSENQSTNFAQVAQYPTPSTTTVVPQLHMPPSLPPQSVVSYDASQSGCNFTPAPSEEIECPTTSECFCPPTTTPEVRSLDNGLEISCETAATIIVEMRGDGNVDIESVRASLGCKGREKCSVKNSRVLQIMDEGA
jgi:hypothetical protein